MSLPTLFISHGSPMLLIEDSPAHRFLAGLGRDLPRPSAILVASAHWATPSPAVSAAALPETIHDFRGFPRELYDARYPAPGAPELAAKAAALLEAGLDEGRGLDHGAWIPLALAWPEADIPVLQVSLQPHLGPAHHLELGHRLKPLRDEGVLILASGALTHNLRDYFTGGDGGGWVEDFSTWIGDAVEQGRVEDLLDYRRRAPWAERNHPTEEHLLPLFLALGAASGPGRIIHRSRDKSLAMDSFRFD
ncbi:class III extradiol ring-cleavage dioxygenase [Telmatospirillum sp. J64-1]|uniref:DODA-type extradiol aromatic ring-opening family dioxygenase n=1 Tax=Telmatospirillum sp. J64-1 TaxID=2502183 RepID=UPI00115C5FD5|nr:class III extradiol ring-cleavage dioxygenase [Telmatospirillum sp. J64-1]